MNKSFVHLVALVASFGILIHYITRICLTSDGSIEKVELKLIQNTMFFHAI